MNKRNSSVIENTFAQKNIIAFLEKYYEVMHTQGKDCILGTIDDMMKLEKYSLPWRFFCLKSVDVR
ncbi:MAG: DUF3791 domain-containing protein [Elusimicrobia bacterium]|nr:DUF3791 domain-containing protein [Elusimicrobiota bacterium]MBR6125668.1 DUF3791 domain-containing protein [Candidatus Saccharibacteria bacterium]